MAKKTLFVGGVSLDGYLETQEFLSKKYKIKPCLICNTHAHISKSCDSYVASAFKRKGDLSLNINHNFDFKPNIVGSINDCHFFEDRSFDCVFFERIGFSFENMFFGYFINSEIDDIAITEFNKEYEPNINSFMEVHRILKEKGTFVIKTGSLNIKELIKFMPMIYKFKIVSYSENSGTMRAIKV